MEEEPTPKRKKRASRKTTTVVCFSMPHWLIPLMDIAALKHNRNRSNFITWCIEKEVKVLKAEWDKPISTE